MLKIITITIMGLSVIVAASLFGGAYHLKRYAETPYCDHSEISIITIKPGQGVSAIARQLHRENIIQSPLKFRLYARLNNLDRRIKAGEYRLSGTMTPAGILDMMVRGAVVLYRLTIPEGYTVSQIANLVETAGILSKEQFLNTAGDKSFVKHLGIKGDSFEGYLFPDTYFFSKNPSPAKVFQTMVNRFWEVFSLEWQHRAKEIGWSIHEVVTLAAMIEKETGDPSERPIISSVFHNRLKKRMRLESDPTVIYGIPNFDGNITRKHLTQPTPYNTYVIRGLPAGPIANPGKDALEAALYPLDTQFLYFVSKKNKTHHFSKTIREHVNAVRKYQLRR